MLKILMRCYWVRQFQLEAIVFLTDVLMCLIIWKKMLPSGSIVREGCEAVRDGGDEGLLAVQGGMCLTVTNNLLCSTKASSSSMT